MSDGARVLGVDDSLTIRKALELVLKPAGYNLVLAASGEEALQKVREFRPEIILLDFILPDMRGTDVCKKLALDPETANIPIILVSAKGAEIRQAYQDVGNVVRYITKPFTPEDLTGAVAETLSGAAVADAAVSDTASVAEVVVETPLAVAAPQVVVRTQVRVVEPEVVETVVDFDADEADHWGADDGVADGGGDSLVVAQQGTGDGAGRRDSLENMFESLLAGLEGVYVEEVDTSAGASADKSQSYLDLVSRVSEQLEEAMAQARSGARFRLSGDGSVRSLEDNFLDAYRRVCRLLFRAVSAGAVQQLEGGVAGVRTLVLSREDSNLFETLRIASSASRGLMVSRRFAQVPILARLYVPTHLVVELSADLLGPIELLRSLREGKRAKVIGVFGTAAPISDEKIAELGIETRLQNGPGLLSELCGQFGIAIPGIGAAAGAVSDHPAELAS